jgi:hypothetical protein
MAADRSAWSLQSVINQAAGLSGPNFVSSKGNDSAQAAAAQQAGGSSAFVPAPSWQGAKPGFFFSRGKQGQG